MNNNNTGISLGQTLTVMIICGLLVTPAWSAEVTYADDAYSTGDTLTADDLNAKFNDIKAGVNSNHSSTKTNRTKIKTNRKSISTNGTDIKSNRASITKGKANTSKLKKLINARTTSDKPSAGDMQYWNGKAWVLVTAPSDTSVHSTLTFVNKKPTWKATYYNIGDRGPAGGFVFYLTDDGAHGLEAAPVDQSRGSVWGCYGTRISDGEDKAIGTGTQNTAEIMAGCSKKRIAARVADAYTLNGYDDWFLPSQDELNEMWTKLADSDGDGRNEGPADPNNLGGFTIYSYWSSSEIGGNIAWIQAFFSGNKVGGVKNSSEARKGYKYRVRAIRAF